MLLDISPSNLDQKYPDKEGTAKMLYMAFTVAKAFPPAIIYIDEIEKIFKAKKKKSKKDPSLANMPNFARLKKPLMAFKKKKYLEKSDRVAVIACSSYPGEINKKLIKTFTEKRFYFPFPNYATRMELLMDIFNSKKIDLHPSFPITTIAHLTEGYTAGNLREAMNKVLTERRMIMSKEIQYRLSEFLIPLSNQPSVYKSKYLEFLVFFN